MNDEPRKQNTWRPISIAGSGPRNPDIYGTLGRWGDVDEWGQHWTHRAPSELIAEGLANVKPGRRR